MGNVAIATVDHEDLARPELLGPTAARCVDMHAMHIDTCARRRS